MKENEDRMTDETDAANGGHQAPAVEEVFPPLHPAPLGTHAGRTEDLKALHADLTTAYREYLEMAKIKPTMLNPAMLGLIQQFLRHNEITAEAPQQTEMHALEKRLTQKRKARKEDLRSQKIVSLNQSKKE